jgi:hypothetical protein
MVMLPLTKKNNYVATFLLCGGSEIGSQGEVYSSKKCFKITPESQNPTWSQEDDMPAQRVMLDGVILPGMK